MPIWQKIPGPGTLADGHSRQRPVMAIQGDDSNGRSQRLKTDEIYGKIQCVAWFGLVNDDDDDVPIKCTSKNELFKANSWGPDFENAFNAREELPSGCRFYSMDGLRLWQYLVLFSLTVIGVKFKAASKLPVRCSNFWVGHESVMMVSSSVSSSSQIFSNSECRLPILVDPA